MKNKKLILSLSYLVLFVVYVFFMYLNQEDQTALLTIGIIFPLILGVLSGLIFQAKK